MTAPERIVLASANPKKVAELRAILEAADLDIELLARPDDVPDVVEDAPDFIGNARLKARALVAATGEWALADDSGLVVDALDGAPGVRSARFAGESATDADNVALLLAELGRVGAVANAASAGPTPAVPSTPGPARSSSGVPTGPASTGPTVPAALPWRSARFRCVIVLAGPDGAEVVAEGTVEGSIADAPSGDAGFGYDPVFVPADGDGRTFAQMSADEKHAISHRGAALRSLAAALRAT